MPSTPGFGTGAVDWSNYVQANQATTDRDRAQVQNYLQGEDTNARKQASDVFGAQGAQPYNSGAGQSSGGASDFAGNLANLYTQQNALQSPEGFEQVYNQMLGATPTPPSGSNLQPGNKTSGNMIDPQQARNSFDAALEGQNAAGLYQGAGALEQYAQGIVPAPGPGPKQTNTPTYPTGQAGWEAWTQEGQKPTNLGPAPAGSDRGTQGGTANPNDTRRGPVKPPAPPAPPAPGAPPVTAPPPPGTPYGSPIKQPGPVVGRNRRGTGAP